MKPLSFICAVFSGHPFVCLVVALLSAAGYTLYTAPETDFVGAGLWFLGGAATAYGIHYIFIFRLWGLNFKLDAVDRLAERFKIPQETSGELKNQACFEHRRSQAMRQASRMYRERVAVESLDAYYQELTSKNKSEIVSEINQRLVRARRMPTG